MITKRYFNTVPGARTIAHFSFGGAHIYWVQLAGLGYKETTSFVVGNQEFRKTGIVITFEQPFPPGARAWVLYDT